MTQTYSSQVLAHEMVALLREGRVPAAGERLEAVVGSDKIRFSLDETSTPAAAAPLWRVAERGESVFHFHAAALGPHAELIFSRWIDMFPLISAAHESATGACLLNLGDEGHAAGLTFCDNRPEFTLIPDCIFMANSGYDAIVAAYRAHDIAWSERRRIAFWRGSTTGIRTGDIFELPRVRMCELMRRLGDQADVALSDLVQISPDEMHELQVAGLVGPRVPLPDFDQYQVHIDVDGNSNSWPGLFCKLLTGSPVIKIESQYGFRQWYYDRLQPWVNYIPAAPDLHDLNFKVKLLLSEPALASTVGANGRALAEDMSMTNEISRSLPTVARRLADG